VNAAYLCNPLVGTSARLQFRRTDWGSSGVPFYQLSDVALHPSGLIVQTFSFAPWGRFVQANGDGGQFFTPFQGGYVIAGTQDGGTPWVQHFVGPEYGGTGWPALVGDTNPNAGLQQTISHFAIAQSDAAQPPMGSFLTRYMQTGVWYPFRAFGSPTFYQYIDTVITEVYSGTDLSNSIDMEREFYAFGWGALRWEAWRSDASTVSQDLTERMPEINWSLDPPGFHMVDGRMWTNLISVDDRRLQGAVKSVADFGWPP
jgi:hypothetical protein